MKHIHGHGPRMDYKIVVYVYSQYTMILNRVLVEGLYKLYTPNILCDTKL
jgi:hypothetical protein